MTIDSRAKPSFSFQEGHSPQHKIKRYSNDFNNAANSMTKNLMLSLTNDRHHAVYAAF